MTETDTHAIDAALEDVLGAAFAHVERVDVVGSLPTALGRRFAIADGSAPGGAVLVVGDEPAVLEQGVSLARSAGLADVHVLLDGGPASDLALRSLHDAGLAVAGVERVLWRAPDAASAGSRLDRLDAETRAVLLRCVRSDDPAAIGRLEAAVLDLQRRMDVLAQLQLEHARTRDVERERLLRLEQLERLVDTSWVEEAERLRRELDELTSTRLVKLGERYWSVRDRLLGRSR